MWVARSDWGCFCRMGAQPQADEPASMSTRSDDHAWPSPCPGVDPDRSRERIDGEMCGGPHRGQ